MTSYQSPYANTQSYQATSYFPQPQGNVYLINNSLEISNVPMGAGLSVALCMSEGTLYVKTLQGGAPTLMVYKMTPYEQPKKEDSTNLQSLIKRIDEFEKQINELKKGGTKLNELL